MVDGRKPGGGGGGGGEAGGVLEPPQPTSRNSKQVAANSKASHRKLNLLHLWQYFGCECKWISAQGVAHHDRLNILAQEWAFHLFSWPHAADK
jgi:hypothetical protein